MPTLINYFDHQTSAERYARARPFIHPTAIEKFQSFANVYGWFERALDVACGTGQSTMVLAQIATSAIGMDISTEMLAQARSLPNIKYCHSSAENIPFADLQFDLITVGLAFHWFNQDKFLAEANRLLRPDGWLVIYNSWFTGEMKEHTAFKQWTTNKYRKRYPAPPRNNTATTNSLAQLHGFTLIGEEGFSNDVVMSMRELVNYLLTQTNIIAVVEQGRECIEGVADWIGTSIMEFFAGDETRTFCFEGKIFYLRKNDGA